MKDNNMGNRLNSSFKKLTKHREMTVLFIILCICIVLGIITPTFMTASNLRATAMGFATDGLLQIGMNLRSLISGGLICRSVPLWRSAELSPQPYIFPQDGISGSLVFALSVISGLIGLVNGIIIGKVGLSPFITTLGMMEIARGATYVVTKGSPVSLSSAPQAFINLGKGSLGGIPNLVIILIVLVLISDYAMKHVASIRNLFYAGSNEKAAILSGVNTKSICLKGLSYVKLPGYSKVNSYWNCLRYSKIFGPRRYRNPHHCVLEGLSPSL